MKKRWISLYVENEVGVMAKISGLFSGKSYSLTSLTVGETADRTISRMTIGVNSDDATFEQIKKQLNRCIEVIKVIDFTNIPIQRKEILFLKVKECKEEDKVELLRMAQIFGLHVADYGKSAVLLECVQTEAKNDDIIQVICDNFEKVEVVRGGSVAIESISVQEK